MGHQDPLNTTGNVSTQAKLHPQLADSGTMAPSVNGLDSSTQRVERRIMNVWGNLNIFTTTTPLKKLSFKESVWLKH